MSALTQLLAGIDDASWEALGSKGLLRRATKELEKGVACAIVEDAEFILQIRVGDCTVSVPREGPARAKCTCGAPGCCHHIITAGLFCRRSPGSTTPPEALVAPAAPVTASTVFDSILALDFSLVKRWAGLAAWRAALRLKSSGVVAAVRNDAAAVVVQLNPIGVHCRFLAGADLDGVIVAGGESKSAKVYVVSAVIGVKEQAGQALPEEETAEAALAEEKGAPRTRANVLATTRSLLEFAIAAGLAHVGSASAERFATLAVSAEGTNLPRLARALKTIADELGLIAAKHGSADTERTLDTMAQAYALTAALEKGGSQAAAHLIGEHRTGYVEMQSAELAGVTVFPWQARSGYRGVTVLFWDLAAKRWNTWSDSRSTTSDPRFDPVKAIEGDAPWGANVSVRALASSRVQLTHAKRNAAGRLSTTKACKAKVTGLARIEEIDFGAREFSAWDALQRHVAATRAAGLRIVDATADWVVVVPARWGNPRFDRVQQRFMWPVFDSTGQELWLVLDYSPLTQHAIEFLETWTPPASGARVLGRVRREEHAPAVEPYSLLPGHGLSTDVVPLLAPPPASKAGAASAPAASPARAEAEEDELEDEASPSPAALPQRDRGLNTAREYLVARAEAGARESTTLEKREEALARQLTDAGLTLLAKSVPRAKGDTALFAGAILRSAYLLALYAQCDSRWVS